MRFRITKSQRDGDNRIVAVEFLPESGQPVQSPEFKVPAHDRGCLDLTINAMGQAVESATALASYESGWDGMAQRVETAEAMTAAEQLRRQQADALDAVLAEQIASGAVLETSPVIQVDAE